LSELQKPKTHLKLLILLVKALHDKSAGDVALKHVRDAIGAGVALSENMVKRAAGRFAAVHVEALEFDKWASCLLDTERPDSVMMLFASERRAKAQAELVAAGLFQLLILENAAQSVNGAVQQLLLGKVLDPAMETEIIQLDLLTRCHEVGVATSEAAIEFFVNHPDRRLHMGVKLFPTGVLLKSVVAAAKAQSIADQRLETDIVKFGTKFATLCAPKALAQDGAGVWILQQEDRLQLKAAHQELAAFRTMGSTTLLQKHVEVVAKAEACIEAAAVMLCEKNRHRFVNQANVPLQKLSTALDNTAAAETSMGVQSTAVAEAESLASGFKDAEEACKAPIDQIGLSDIASMCSKSLRLPVARLPSFDSVPTASYNRKTCATNYCWTQWMLLMSRQPSSARCLRFPFSKRLSKNIAPDQYLHVSLRSSTKGHAAKATEWQHLLSWGIQLGLTITFVPRSLPPSRR
jgi:hypothetical protein